VARCRHFRVTHMIKSLPDIGGSFIWSRHKSVSFGPRAGFYFCINSTSSSFSKSPPVGPCLSLCWSWKLQL
jgi:hypothetical protein